MGDPADPAGKRWPLLIRVERFGDETCSKSTKMLFELNGVEPTCS